MPQHVVQLQRHTLRAHRSRGLSLYATIPTFLSLGMEYFCISRCWPTPLASISGDRGHCPPSTWPQVCSRYPEIIEAANRTRHPPSYGLCGNHRHCRSHVQQTKLIFCVSGNSQSDRMAKRWTCVDDRRVDHSLRISRVRFYVCTDSQYLLTYKI